MNTIILLSLFLGIVALAAFNLELLWDRFENWILRGIWRVLSFPWTVARRRQEKAMQRVCDEAEAEQISALSDIQSESRK